MEIGVGASRTRARTWRVGGSSRHVLYREVLMHRPHLASGGRYPVLRSLAIIYLIGAGVAILGGLIAAGWALVRFPFTVSDRVILAVASLAATFFIVIGMLAVAELLK